MVPVVESLLEEESRRLAYKDRPGREGLAAVSGAMDEIWIVDEWRNGKRKIKNGLSGLVT